MVIPIRAGWRTAASSEPSQTMSGTRPLQCAPSSAPDTSPPISAPLPPPPPPRPILRISAFPPAWGRPNYQICVYSTLHPASTSSYYRSCLLLGPSPVI